MANFRQIYCKFWSSKEVMEKFSTEDKLFYLYILTNEKTNQIGVYKLIKRMAACEIGWSTDNFNVIFDRFDKAYNMIKYSEETNEIAILNWGKYNLNRGGAPVVSCVKSDYEKIENKKMVDLIVENSEGKIHESLLPILTQHQKNNTNRKTNGTTISREYEYEYEYKEIYIEQNSFKQKFDELWKLYPNRKGKDKIKTKDFKTLEKIGFETLKVCIERYIQEKEKYPWKEWQHGSTFFKGGYIDYLDENYVVEKEKKQIQESNNKIDWGKIILE